MPRLRPNANPVPLNAFEREFNPRERKYCGPKNVVPDDYTRRGSPYECLKVGFYIGSHPSPAQLRKKEKENAARQARDERMRLKEKKLAIVETALESRKKAKQLLEQGIAKTATNTAIKTVFETKKKIAKDISKMGLVALKKEIRLSKLNSRELSSIANRLHPIKSFEPHYSTMKKQELIDELVRRGFKL